MSCSASTPEARGSSTTRSPPRSRPHVASRPRPRSRAAQPGTTSGQQRRRPSRRTRGGGRPGHRAERTTGEGTRLDLPAPDAAEVRPRGRAGRRRLPARARRRLGLPLAAARRREPGSDHGYDVVDHSPGRRARGGPDGLGAPSTAARASGSACSSTSCRTTWASPSPPRTPGGGTCSAPAASSRARRGLRRRLGFGGRPAAHPGARRRATSRRRWPVESTARAALLRPPLPAGPRHRRRRATTRATVHDRQHYELVNWRRADAELNYRRFFAVNTLAGIRVEVPVGVRGEPRRDRPLGPRGSRRRPARRPPRRAAPTRGATSTRSPSATGGAYVLVEKILEGDERAAAVAGRRRHDRVRRARRHRPRARRPARRGALDALDARLRGGDRPRTWADADPRHEAGRRRRHPALRGAAPRARRCDAAPRRSRCRRRRASPSCSRASRCTARTCRRRASTSTRRRPPPGGHRPDLARAVDDAAARARRPGPPGRRPLPADERHGHGQGRRGHRLLPLHPARLAHRGRRRPGRVRDRRRRVPRAPAGRHGAAAAVDDDAVDARHEARRGRARAHRRARRDAPAEWAATLARLHALAPLRRRPVRGAPVAGDRRRLAGESRERLHAYAEKAAREAGVSTTLDGAATPSSRRACTRSSTRCSTTSAWPRCSPPSSPVAAAGLVELARRPSSSSSRRPACPTCTRAASCGRRPSSTPTTGGPSTSSCGARARSTRSTRAAAAGRRDRRGEAARHLPGAAAATRPARAVRRGTCRSRRPARPPSTSSPSTAAAPSRSRPGCRSGCAARAADGGTRRSCSAARR